MLLLFETVINKIRNPHDTQIEKLWNIRSETVKLKLKYFMAASIIVFYTRNCHDSYETVPKLSIL